MKTTENEVDSTTYITIAEVCTILKISNSTL